MEDTNRITSNGSQSIASRFQKWASLRSGPEPRVRDTQASGEVTYSELGEQSPNIEMATNSLNQTTRPSKEKVSMYTTWIRKPKSAKWKSSWSSGVYSMQTIYKSCITWFQNTRLVSRSKHTFSSWKAGVISAILVALVILVLNFSFFLWATKRHKYSSAGLWTLFEGNCKTANNINLVGHGVINVLSTILLGLSNYCMQLLASPTRGDVDKAHRKREWVDIGVQSFRNCWKRHISVTRTSLWILLALSSTPLHLLWNSSVVYSPKAYEYYEVTVSDTFVAGLPFDDTVIPKVFDFDDGNTLFPDNLHILQRSLQPPVSYEHLTNLECQKNYAQDFVIDRSDVIVVVNTTKEDDTLGNSTGIVLGVAGGGRGAWPYKWLCPSSQNANFRCLDDLFHNAEQWKFQSYGNPPVSYCLSKKMDHTCKIEYAYTAGIWVCVANVIKLCCFIGVYFLFKKYTQAGQESSKDQLLVTTGDAIASFLADPDPYTFNMSLVAKRDFQNGIWKLRFFQITPIAWIDRGDCSRFRAIGRRRWFLGHLFAVVLWTVPLIFLSAQAKHFKNDLHINFEVLRQLGLGKPNGRFLFQSWTQNSQQSDAAIVNNIILSNIPQLVVSLGYFFYNNHFTCMAAAMDYAKFANTGSEKKKGLRVLNPKPDTDQRSTYFLSLPLKYWLLLSTISTLLNWLASQAVFFARVITLDHWMEVTTWSINHVGYSIPGLILFTIVAFVASLIVLAFGLIRLKTDMPLASTCSAALSAACHPADSRYRDSPTDKWKVKTPEFDHWEQKVSWGVEVGEGTLEDPDTEEYKGYCTFSSREVVAPKEGWVLG